MKHLALPSSPLRAVGFVVMFACAQIALAQYASTKPILEPTVFAPGLISTGDYEVCPQFSPDGQTFYFVKAPRR